MNTDKILAESIAKDYAPKEDSKIVALKKLDNRAKLPATIFTYSWGIVFALVFGTGMSLAMQVIGNSMPNRIHRQPPYRQYPLALDGPSLPAMPLAPRQTSVCF